MAGESAWEERPPGTFRVNLSSSQFRLAGYRAGLTALAERAGYTVTEPKSKEGWSAGVLVIAPKKDSECNG